MSHLAFTWRHLSDSQNIAKYRLSDHVWIWKALKSIEDLIAKVHEYEPSPDSSLQEILALRTSLSYGKKRGDAEEPKLEFTADELRKQILRRFTIENDISKKRMLGVTRSARETRFLFHSRDTVLYYGIKWGFFRDEAQSVSELWELLVKSQTLHDDENDELQWANPLRYALAVLMGMENHQLDKNYTGPEMALHAKRVLLNSSSENGLFPGQIDETTKEPALFDEELFRDFYFHVSFEIPCILLRDAWKGDYRDGEQGRPDIKVTAFDYGNPGEGSGITFGQSLSPSQDRQPKHQPRRRLSVIQLSPVDPMQDLLQSPLGSSENAATNEGVRSNSLAMQIARSLKRNIPYGKFVDVSNIVEMPEEWLYEYPRFLDFDPPNNDDAASILKQISKQSQGSFISRVVGELSSGDTPKFSMGDIFGDSLEVPMPLIMIDVPKGKKQRKSAMGEPIPWSFQESSYGDFWSALQKRRTAKAAKKRMIYLGPGDCRVAALCYLASPEMDRDHVSQFFDRHATSRVSIVNDATIATSNVWETELHFSFYQLVDDGSTKRKFSPVRGEKFTKCFSLKTDSSISEAAMGFRFVGDFFDRYWTCHIIENFSGAEDAFTDDLRDGKLPEHWQQRKVLELILFERILLKVHQSTDDIIDAIGNDPDKISTTKMTAAGENNIFGTPRFEGRSIKNLQEIHQILVALKNKFTSILEAIDLWKDRESTRGQERPRWTRHDEQKYRGSINKHSARQEKHVRELRNQQASIEFLITLVISAQEANRSERSLQETQNVRLFTYLTAFFLPVGLSSSLFGMGQIPDRKVVITMVITAVIALAFTALVLYCTLSEKPFATNIRMVLKDGLKGSGSMLGMLRSLSGSVWLKMKALGQDLKPSKKTVEKGAVGADLETGRKGSDVIHDQEHPEGPVEN
ncbi:hypothetical protein MMC07_008457 [Pseudocyphellaria aurata]|nr:hypothetical protein [Pseudocyphellaria aurata]